MSRSGYGSLVRRADAVAWEQDQRRGLRRGDWVDPRRGKVPLSQVADGWLTSRGSVKRRSRESDEANWRLHVAPAFGRLPVASINKAMITRWVGGLIESGASSSSVTRYLAVLRLVLGHAVEDGRININPAVGIKAPSGAHARREGQFLTLEELHALAEACETDYADLVLFLGLSGVRWGEAAGLQVGDVISVPGPGVRLHRAVLSSRVDGTVFVDTLKTSKSRTVPLVPELVAVVERWTEGRAGDEWLFAAPQGGPLNEGNWKRTVKWTLAIRCIDRPTLRVHDLRHTAASLWLGAGADPKVVQRILGHASAAMTMDLYGHLIDTNLWDAANRVGAPEDRAIQASAAVTGDILGTRLANHTNGEPSGEGVDGR